MENDLENTLQKLQLGQENNIEELNRVRTKKLREDKIRGIIKYYFPVPTVIFARYFQDHFPFCPFPFFERRVRNSCTTNY
jgi:hypothetical protein